MINFVQSIEFLYNYLTLYKYGMGAGGN